MKRNQWPIIIIVILLGLSVLATACGGGSIDPPDQADPVRVDPQPSQATVTEADIARSVQPSDQSQVTAAQTSQAALDDPEDPEGLTDVDMSYTYMGNANSMILHLTTCNSAAQTKVSNRVYFDSREEAIEAGYVPCKRCKP